MPFDVFNNRNQTDVRDRMQACVGLPEQSGTIIVYS
jgi:hypothetical protein